VQFNYLDGRLQVFYRLSCLKRNWDIGGADFLTANKCNFGRLRSSCESLPKYLEPPEFELEVRKNAVITDIPAKHELAGLIKQEKELVYDLRMRKLRERLRIDDEG